MLYSVLKVYHDVQFMDLMLMSSNNAHCDGLVSIMLMAVTRNWKVVGDLKRIHHRTDCCELGHLV
jgi:hypothetical protein